MVIGKWEMGVEEWGLGREERLLGMTFHPETNSGGAVQLAPSIMLLMRSKIWSTVPMPSTLR